MRAAIATRHPSFDALKALHATLRWHIPDGRQIFGEWLWARHSIAYDCLPAYLLVFGIREAREATWLAWDECVAACGGMGLQPVPCLWRGVVGSEEELQRRTVALVRQSCCGPEQEGVVVRVEARFSDDDFNTRVAKWVRASHVQTSQHWSQQQVTRNQRVG